MDSASLISKLQKNRSLDILLVLVNVFQLLDILKVKYKQSPIIDKVLEHSSYSDEATAGFADFRSITEEVGKSCNDSIAVLL